MSYNDMIGSKCNSSTNLQEVYDCIYTNTFNLTEVIPTLTQGATVSKCKYRNNFSS